jgi:hypothetical protein
VRLVGTRVALDRFDSPAGLLAALERRLAGAAADAGRAELDAAGAGLQPAPDRVVRLSVEWRAMGPLMVASGAAGIAVAVLPAVTRRADQLALLLPGTSIKGALRTRAERIVRSLLPELAEPSEFRRQLDLPLVRWLFGMTPEPPPRGDGRRPRVDPLQHEPGLAAVRVDDCVSRLGMDPARWDDLLAAGDAVAAQLVLDTAARGWRAATHVALDPWTGGPVPGALYTAIEPHPDGAEWSPIEIEVDLGRLPDDLARPALALLLLTLDDLARGEIPLGHGANRGYGDVEVTRATLTGAGDLGLDAVETLEPAAGRGRGVLAGSRVRAALLPAWSEWLEAEVAAR